MSDHFFYTSAEAAARLGIGTATLAVYRSQGKGPPFVKVGERGKDAIVYRRPDLDEWNRERRRKAKRSRRRAALTREANRRARLAEGAS